MTATELAVIEGDVVRPATREEAEARRDSIRRTLELAVDGLVLAWRARDYEALGYGRGQAGWEAYLEESYGDLRHLRLPVEARRDRLVLMHGAGMSVRAASATPGMAGRQQTANDLEALREAGRIVDGADVVGIDGKRQPRRPAAPSTGPADSELELEQAPPAPALTTVDRVVLGAQAAGTRGVTTLDLMRRLRLRQGPVSAALSRAAKRGRVVHAGAWRDGFGVYHVPTPALPAGPPA